MKAHFKYAFKEGFHVRGVVFFAILAFNLVFVTLGALDLLHIAAIITGLSLSGVGIAVMVIFNIISDVNIIRRMFTSPGAYLYALPPVSRTKMLFASICAITVWDVVSMTVAITGVVWQSLILAGSFVDVWGYFQSFPSFVLLDYSVILFGIGGILSIVAGYMYFIAFIIFCIVLYRSVFYQKRLGVLFTALIATGVIYLSSLSNFLLFPFAYIHYYWGFFQISLSPPAGTIAYGILILLQAAALFFISGRLMERKLNI